MYNKVIYDQYLDKVKADVINSIVFASAFLNTEEIKMLYNAAIGKIKSQVNKDA